MPRGICKTPNCNNQVRSRGLCIGCGGGKRCTREGCGGSAEGPTEFCSEHGEFPTSTYCAGGRKRPSSCSYEGCNKKPRSGSDKCQEHGGGKRCAVEGCSQPASWRHDICKDCRDAGHEYVEPVHLGAGPSIAEWCEKTVEEMWEEAKNLKTEATGEHVMCTDFYETHEDEADEEPVAEAEENDEEMLLSLEEVVDTVISDIIEAIAGAEEDDESVEGSLDDFIVFHKGVDYRSSVLPQNFMGDLYEESYRRKKQEYKS